MRWVIVQAESEEFPYHLVLVGSAGVGKVWFGAKTSAAVLKLQKALEDHELLTGGVFTVPEPEPAVKPKRSRSVNTRKS